MVNLELLDARLYSIAISSRAEAQRQYDLSADHERCIVMLDLVSSTNHRFIRGPMDAFQRTTVFYELCHAIFDHSNTLQIAKKMGDGILIFGTDANEVMDACLLVMRAERLIRNEFRDDLFPFQVRIGVSNGLVRKLPGPNEDYLGSAIDELSKIMGVIKPLPDNHIFIARSFRERYKQALSCYRGLQFGDLKWWDDNSGATRLTHSPVEFYLTQIDLSEVTTCSEPYVLWAATNK